MPRRKRHRFVSAEPPISIFKPAGIPARDLKEILITVDEFEAIRLADYLGKNQRDASEEMHVSQPTFNRILTSARQKVAKGLVEGCVLRIEGGRYVLADGTGHLECVHCGETASTDAEFQEPCPKCGSTEFKWTRY